MEPDATAARVSRVNAADGLDQFYVAAYPRLVGLLSAMADGEDAEAAVQDAFVALVPRWTRVSRYEDPEAWVRQVAVRRLVSRHRRARVACKALPLLAGERARPGPNGDRVDVQAALSRLPVDHRAVLVLHHALQMPVEQVALLLGVPTGTVKSRLSRARAGFAQHYGQEAHAHD
jgi:DNA-directed RNA polymerase specialized sigma24 family protein